MWEDGVRVGLGKVCKVSTAKFCEDLDKLFDKTQCRCNIKPCGDNYCEATCIKG